MCQTDTFIKIKKGFQKSNTKLKKYFENIQSINL
jgi:hypothetical protein